VYVVVENGDPYPVVYKTYAAAVAAVREKHKEDLEAELKWLAENWGHSVNVLDVAENEKGKMYLYVEKGIHIYVYRLPVSG
jgi:hypothetical protein